MQPVIDTLSIGQKRALLASLLNQDRPPLQLSMTQERLWQLDRLQPGTSLYNFQTAIELHGRLLPKALEIAALQVVLRHEVLQTRYGIEKGKPALSLAPPRHIVIGQHDLSALPEPEQYRRMEELGMRDVKTSFDLTCPPLLRLTLIRLASEKHCLYLTMHHIASDFFSLDLFLFEMGAFYSALLQDTSAALPLITASYWDFAELQRNMEDRGLYEPHLEYWRRALAGARSLEWFSDHVRPVQNTGNAGTEFFGIPTPLMRGIEAFAREHHVTPYMVLLAGFNILLHGCSGQDDLIVGSPTSGRIRSEYESLIGMFSYPVLLRASMAGCLDFRGLLHQIRGVALEAAEHADVPLAKVAEVLHRGSSQQSALFRAMFSYVSRLRNLCFDGLVCRRRSTNRGITDLDFFMTVYPDLDEWHGVLEYSADLFEQRTIRALIAAFIEILESAVAKPELPVAALAAMVPIKPPARVAIASTFTAEPLTEVLTFWARELNLRFMPVIAPYNQLFQQLMDPRGMLLTTGNALNVLLVRPEDWICHAQPNAGRQRHQMEECVRDFVAAVRGAVLQMNCPLKIYLCPTSPRLDAVTTSVVEMAERSIREELADINTIEVLDAKNCAECYLVKEIHDPQTDSTANIPYKPDFYVALGTMIARQLRVQVAKPSKALVLDCDNTLWQGLCAQEGSQGVVISEGHRALQKFVLKQAAAGVLICLISKNAPEHVFAVLRENLGMLLKEEHISAYRINWQPKSSNLRELVAELQLGHDSFVFIDDDARECAEVSARCPEVLTLHLPQSPGDIGRFLQHLWIFDREDISQEDRQRTRFYRDNQQRNMARGQLTSLAEFLETLELRVDLHPATTDRLSRIAQLSQRTNQFNSSGVIWNPLELQFAMQQGLEAMSVEVSDRFGEYGLVGAVMYRRDNEFLAVESFYLSCRVLGRGVEHRILSELGHIAGSMNLSRIRINYCPSSRNQPFRHFLDQLPGQMNSPAGISSAFLLTANDAAQAKLVPEEDAPAVLSAQASVVLQRAVPPRSLGVLARLPHELTTAAQIIACLDRSNSAQRDCRVAADFVAPCAGLENSIAAEWRAILRLEKVGRNDNFFELGGNSLLLVRLNSNLVDKLGVDISSTEMFQYPTIASLAGHIAGQTSVDVPREAVARGAKVRAFWQERKRHSATR